MKVEHKLTAVQRERLRGLNGELQQTQQQQFVLLGRSAILAQQADAMATTIANIVKLIEEESGLPAPAPGTYYMVSSDGSMLIGETSDLPAAPSPGIAALTEHHSEGEGGRVNGRAS